MCSGSFAFLTAAGSSSGGLASAQVPDVSCLHRRAQTAESRGAPLTAVRGTIVSVGKEYYLGQAAATTATTEG